MKKVTFEIAGTYAAGTGLTVTPMRVMVRRPEVEGMLLLEIGTNCRCNSIRRFKYIKI